MLRSRSKEVWKTGKLGVLVLRGSGRRRGTDNLCMRRMAFLETTGGNDNRDASEPRQPDRNDAEIQGKLGHGGWYDPRNNEEKRRRGKEKTGCQHPLKQQPYS